MKERNYIWKKNWMAYLMAYFGVCDETRAIIIGEIERVCHTCVCAFTTSHTTSIDVLKGRKKYERTSYMHFVLELKYFTSNYKPFAIAYQLCQFVISPPSTKCTCKSRNSSSFHLAWYKSEFSIGANNERTTAVHAHLYTFYSKNRWLNDADSSIFFFFFFFFKK